VVPRQNRRHRRRWQDHGEECNAEGAGACPLHSGERRRRGQKSLTNIVRVLRRSWGHWLKRIGPGTALDACRRYGAKLIISRLDRLSRDPVFLLSLRDAGIDFVAVDMPNANRMTVGIMALVAEQEREAISTRTKAALAAARARGVKLGTPKPERSNFKDPMLAGVAGLKGGEVRAEQAKEFGQGVRGADRSAA
jgi:hypothetical protein